MPRIPIPVIQQQSFTPVGAPAPRVPLIAVNDNTGQAISGLGNALARASSSIQQVEEEDGRAWASKTASDDQLKWMTRLQQEQEQAAPGAPNFTPSLISEFDDYSTKAIAESPPSARRFYETQLSQLRGYIGQRSIVWQAQQHRANTVDQYQQGADADAAAISLDPSLYEDRRAARMAALSVSNLPPDVRTTLAQRSDGALAYAAGASTVDIDPHGAMAAFAEASKGTPPEGYGWIGRLQAPQIQVLRRRAESQATAIDSRAKLMTDRANALGRRAVTEADQQLSSGVPATADQWLTWMGQSAGTASEQEIHSRIQSEQEIQDVLRKPIAEQQTYLAQKINDQNTNGADLTQQANLRRLSTAVETNIKLLQESPLEYAQRRAGVPMTPLDLGQIATPDGAAAVGPLLRDRTTTIRALQAQNPDRVSMHPLLPGEAQQLSDALNQGTAVQRSGLLGTLYRSFGDPTAYRGAMEQIKTVNPFMARMGERAASYAQAKLTNNWFSPDVVQSAGDVSAIALHGDEILRQGGKDGTLKFPVPKDEEFMAALQSKVSDLYRGAGPGTGDAAGYTQDAYAVKAYYVGRAAQDGDISGQVDSTRMDQAITAVLGKSVNFQGNGEVRAPWGMNETDFTTRATAALTNTLKEAGVLDKISTHMGNVGLIGVGGGVYFPTLAGTPVADSNGRPLVIRLTPDADAERDEFGRRLADQIPKDSPK